MKTGIKDTATMCVMIFSGVSWPIEPGGVRLAISHFRLCAELTEAFSESSFIFSAQT